MISYFKRTVASRNLKSLDTYEKGCWVNAISPDTVELERLSSSFDLDMDLLLEGIDEHELARMDVFEKRVYVFIKILSPNEKKLVTLLVILGDDFLITVCREDANLVTVLDKTKALTTRKLSFLMELLLEQNELLDKAIHKVVKSVQKKKSDTEHLSEDDMEKLLEEEEFLNTVISSHFYSNLLYMRMSKKLKFDSEDKNKLDDLIIETTQSLTLAKTSLKNISNLRNFYSIILTNRLNRTIKILTIFTIFVTIPAAISGFYGMNIALPFQSSPHAFWYVVGLVVAIWALFLVFLRRNKVI